MLSDQYVFTQLMTFLPKHEFRSCVQRYRGDRRIRNFSCLDQFLCMAFAQLTYRDSLRGKVSRSTLADANERRDWRIYSDFAQALIRHARQLYAADSFGVDLEHTA